MKEYGKDRFMILLQTNDILDKYVSIHDRVFKLTIRKFIPIPFFFDEIPFLELYKKLSGYCEELELLNDKHRDLQSKFNINDELSEDLDQFITRLIITQKKFCEILSRLDSRIESAKNYLKQEYDKDMDEYKILISNYQEIGRKLNNRVSNDPALWL